jgi:hypothetical protein
VLVAFDKQGFQVHSILLLKEIHLYQGGES